MPAAAPADAVGFNHLAHSSQVEVSGGEELACATCHRIGFSGRVVALPGHRECFSRCHTAPTSIEPKAKKHELTDEQRAICNACHPNAQLEGFLRGARKGLRPPGDLSRLDPDFALALSHQAHASQACTRCHDVPQQIRTAAKPRRSHADCARCHGGAGRDVRALMPTMLDCIACHREAVGPDLRPQALSGPLPVYASFSHRAHQHRGAHDCLTCHDELAREPGLRLPTPVKESCEGCHDGRIAFGTTSASCRRCHQSPDRLRPRSHPLRPVFSHRGHLDRLPADACQSCHQVTETGEVLSGARGHQSCADASCHAAEFRRIGAPLCTICHVGDEPWRPLHLDTQKRGHTDFGSRFSHAEHPSSTDCRRCHEGQGVTRAAARNPHAACASTGCHGSSELPMVPCEGCHTLELADRRATLRRSSAYSVRVKFRHEGAHALVADCLSCHPSPSGAQSWTDIPTPPKSSCGTCHDGKNSFSMTGHGCVRCHEKASRPRAQPAR